MSGGNDEVVSIPHEVLKRDLVAARERRRRCTACGVAVHPICAGCGAPLRFGARSRRPLDAHGDGAHSCSVSLEEQLQMEAERLCAGCDQRVLVYGLGRRVQRFELTGESHRCSVLGVAL